MTLTGYTVRQALDVDFGPLADEHIPALAAELGKAHAKYFRRKFLLQRAGKGLILGAFRKNRPVGAVLVLWGEPAQERRVRLDFPDVPLLYHVRVKNSLQGRGIGTQLLAAVHDELRARGHKQVVLGVDITNKDAIRLYERLGYDLVDRTSWGLGDSRYELMLLDLEKNDRLEFLGSVTTRLDLSPVVAAERPPALSKRELGSVIIELLGETSETTEAAKAARKAAVRDGQKRNAGRPAAGAVKTGNMPAATATVPATTSTGTSWTAALLGKARTFAGWPRRNVARQKRTLGRP
jgi:ribosomal protein S18 acetylase RimI-like enzyme